MEYAFEYARRCGAAKKGDGRAQASIMKATDDCSCAAWRAGGRQLSDIEFSDKIVDATCMGLVQNDDYRCLVLPNLVR